MQFGLLPKVLKENQVQYTFTKLELTWKNKKQILLWLHMKNSY